MRDSGGHIQPDRIRRAFTIIEVLMVVFIIGVISTLAVPRYSNFVAQHRAESAARRIAADIALARRHARLTSTSQTIQFDVSNNRYVVSGMSSLDNPAGFYTVSLADEPYGASIASISLDSNDNGTITFDGYGVPNTGGSIVVGVGVYSRTIQIDAATGRTTISTTVIDPAQEVL
ncbi:MAG: prepilin-type N-terminal cleavage/methylation domain-containing protein [Planctomycetes bacterium]|nr:prepilin-type N-terminal cleavage/methylation domain-containing protein [Planctomycetota bacterium]